MWVLNQLYWPICRNALSLAPLIRNHRKLSDDYRAKNGYGKRVYLDRTLGRYRDYRRLDCPSSSRRAKSPGSGQPDGLPGADEQIEVKVREALPDAPAGPIRYVAHLPSGSVLEGRCNGQVVYFLKTYQGNSFSGYTAGDQLLGIQKEGHAVHYEGRLSPDGLQIEGQWSIEADPEYGTRRTDGLFLLRRQLIGLDPK